MTGDKSHLPEAIFLGIRVCFKKNGVYMFSKFFTQNMDIVFMAYGFSFVVMGIAIFAQPHRKSIFKLSNIIWLLALFGLLHGLNEWFDMFSLIEINGHGHNSAAFSFIRLMLLSVSYLFLFEFGRRLVILRRGQFLPQWVTVACSFLTLMFIYNTSYEPSIWPRYLLGLPGGILSALGFFFYYQDNKVIFKLTKRSKYFICASLSMAFYSILGGLVVPKADFFPAILINYSSFADIFNVPVQLYRTLFACVLSWSVWHILDIFNWEMRQKLLDNLSEISIAKNYLDNIIFSTTDGLMIVESNERIKTINPALSELLGYDKQELMQMPIAAVFGINENLFEKIGYNKLVKGAVSKNYETFCKMKNGKLIPVLVSVSNIQDENKGAEEALIMVKDISARVKLMRELELSEKKYRAIVENSNDLIWILDKNGNFTFINKKAEEISGYNPEDLAGKSFASLIPSADIERVGDIFRETISGKAGRYEGGFYKKDGSLCVMSVNTIPMYAGSEIISTISFGQDITERVKMERDIWEQKEFLITVLKSINHPFSVIDTNDYAVKVSNCIAGFWSPVKPQTCYSLLHNQDSPCQGEHICPVEKIKKTKMPVTVEHVYYDKDNNVKNFEVHVYPVFDKYGEVSSMIEYSFDITARKKSEEELKDAYNQLTISKYRLIQAEKMETVGRLASGVAHEVKNPLAIILQGVEYLALKAPEDNHDFRTVFAYISDAVVRANNIIKDLMDFSRMSEINIEPAGINDIIEQALLLAKNFIEVNHIEVIRDFETDIPFIRVDRNKIEQAAVNIIMNAVDAMPGGGQLNIRAAYARESAKKVVVEIEDSGTGIAEDILDKIFDPFFTTKRSKGRTGLGLAVVKNIMDMHHAEVEVGNKKDSRGVKVSLRFNL